MGRQKSSLLLASPFLLTEKVIILGASAFTVIINNYAVLASLCESACKMADALQVQEVLPPLHCIFSPNKCHSHLKKIACTSFLDQYYFNFSHSRFWLELYPSISCVLTGEQAGSWLSRTSAAQQCSRGIGSIGQCYLVLEQTNQLQLNQEDHFMCLWLCLC